MDENQFFAGLQGEKQQGSDFVDGAEHFVRLKMQTGYQQRQQDEIEKEAMVGALLGGAAALGAGAGAIGLGKSLMKNPATQAPGAGQWGQASKLAGELTESIGDSKRPDYCESCDRMRDACLCKTASLRDILDKARAGFDKEAFVDQAIGYMIGKGKGRGQAERGEDHSFGGTQALSTLLPGGLGYQIGRYHGHEEHKKGQEKKAQEFDELRGNEEGRPADERSVADRLKARLQEKTANALLDRLKDVDPILMAATGGGALAGGIGTYLASRPQKSLDGKSRAEDELEGQVAAQEGRPERGLLHKMKNRTTEMEHGYAQAFREHPAKAGLLGAATGALGGYGLGRLGGAIARMRGGAA